MINLSAVTSPVFRGFSKAIKVFGSLSGKIVNFGVLWAGRGFLNVARYSMPGEFEDNQNLQIKVNDWPNFIAKIILFPITYLPAAVAAAFIAPFFVYGVRNLVQFGKFFKENFVRYTKMEDDPSSTFIPNYSGNLYGLPGAFFGLIAGFCYVIPKIISSVFLESMQSGYFWFINGLKLADGDEKTNLERRFLSKVLGYVPFGLPLSFVAFIVGFGGRTLVTFLYNTVISLVHNTVRGWNMAFFDQTSLKISITMKRTSYQHFLGSFGFIIGLGLGGLVLGVVTSTRALISSAINILKFATHGYSWPLIGNKYLYVAPYKFALDFSSFAGFKNSLNFSYDEHFFGLPGYLLTPVALSTGLIVGLGVRLIYESSLSAVETLNLLINHCALRGLKKNNTDLKFEDTKFFERKNYERLIGFMGITSGLVLSFLVTPLIGLARYIATNIDSGKRTFHYLTQQILKSAQEFPLDKRPIWVKFLSVPGGFIGSTLGVCVRVSAESALSFMNTTKVWIRFSLSYIQDDIKEIINNYFVIDKNRTINSKIFGCLGYVFGGIFSSFVVFGVFFVRFAITNADSAKRAFLLKVNQEVSDANKINLTEDKRNEVLQNFGLPGKMLGNILGSIGAMSIASEYYFEYVFKSVMLVAFYEAPLEIRQQVILPTAKNKRLFEGLPGAFFGGIIGGVSFVVVISGRFLLSSAQTVYHITLDMVKFVRIKENIPRFTEFAILKRLFSKPLEDALATPPSPMRLDKRKTMPFFLGLPLGLPLGAIVGSSAAIAVGFFRIIMQTSVSTFNSTVFYARFALPEDDIFNLPEIKQTAIDKILGSFGQVIGFFSGITGFIIFGVMRILVDTIITTWLTFTKVSNLFPVNYSKEIDDTRSVTDKTLGIFGYIIGLLPGLSLYFFRIIINVFINSLYTAKRDFINIELWSIGYGENIFGIDEGLKANFINTKSTRTLFEQHGFGFIGHLLGIGIGLSTASIIVSLRFCLYNFRLSLYAFQNAANFVLTQKLNFADKYIFDPVINKIQFGAKTLTLPKFFKVLAAFPGLFLGKLFAFGGVILPYYTKEFMRNNFLSFKHLSKSLLNVGLGEFYFDEGVQADKRPLRYKMAGVFGYLISAPLALLPIVRYTFKIMLILIVGSISFIPTAVYKYTKMRWAPRFPDAHNQDATIGRIKNLYSAYQSLDELKSFATIQQSKTGGKGFWNFVLKSLFFNLNLTLAEDVLDAKLDFIYNKDEETYNKKIDTIKANRHGSFLFRKEISARRNLEADREVEHMKKIIDCYLESHSNLPPKPFQSLRTTYNLFVCKKPANEELVSNSSLNYN